MTTIITTNGDTILFQSEYKTKLKIINNPDIQSIIKLAPSILDVHVENNVNLVSIKLNNRGLRNLHIVNNPILTFIQAVPITQSVTIKDNPQINYDILREEILGFPTTVEYMPHIEIIKPLNKCNPTLHINDAIFTNNEETRQVSPDYLNNSNQFIIHNEYYDGRAYPIITIPKGMLLYTYTHLNDSEEILPNIYNIDSYDNYENELKFFYSVPYGAQFGIEGKYNHCHIVVLTADVRLLCMLSPAPQNMETFMFPERNPVNTPQCIYYDKDVSFPCELYDHDLCFQKEFRVAMNLQGYINIDIDDSMSNGSYWKQAYDYVKYRDIIKDYLLGSCISSAMTSTSNYNYINRIYSMNTPPNTVFGLPQIVLCPLKTQLFDQPRDYNTYLQKAKKMKYIFDNFNYYLIDSCLIEDIETTIEQLKSDIVQNKQYPLFYMLNTHKDPAYTHWKNVGPLTVEDVDYLQTYQNNVVGCAFETIAYNIKMDGGTARKSLKRRNKTHKKMKTREKCPLVFKKTSFGMPIMYRA